MIKGLSKLKKTQNTDTVYKKMKNVVSRISNDGVVTVIKMEDMDHFYKIDLWAAEVWKLIDGKTTTRKISEKIQKKSGLKDSLIFRQTEKIILSLKSNGLIEKK